MRLGTFDGHTLGAGRLAEGLVVPHPDSAHTSLHDPVRAQISLLTDD